MTSGTPAWAGRTTPSPSDFRPGKTVTTEPVLGFTRWRIVSIDGSIALIEALDPKCPLHRIKRNTNQLRIEKTK
jgi:hypothetical protein